MNNSSTPAPLRTTSHWPFRLGALILVASLAACGSSVKLDEAPVEDRNTTTGQAGQNGSGSGVDPRGVTGVQVPGMDSEQPAALSRIIYFDYDSFEVRAEFTSALEANARYLKANPSRKVALEGHTDERGGREYNLALGQKRAEAVRRSLALLGVNESQMEPVSFGEEKPAALGMDESSYAKNRRVELTYR
ncbi:peptidoglycan-associated lipoprotein Pal [Hydrogenophaga pseudoflava]|uniref:peptidoglycan-associated lipoprotein Pal n=1 Tax=Hydrogenophaga pseudoflava TaxID=47421 RepID=UPI0027E400B4|nr:peptidoglycan-associated lipoprotein Pal [Hydrogenophaga pseudoflava]MDQ7744481.1 peptidoglycan-associated lipoprotein Pal [Hydrogenophaga pseudoflava]